MDSKKSKLREYCDNNNIKYTLFDDGGIMLDIGILTPKQLKDISEIKKK